ncbi:MAG: hypothetical protein IJY11_03345 [Clostridia bacterium]|nr:hypothetical protein [Clostridia bacterium]
MKKKWLLGLLSRLCVATCALGFAACSGSDSGDAGKDGKSAYEIWLETGHTGDEEDFLDCLKDSDDTEEEGTPGLHYQRISGKDEYRVIDVGLAAEYDIVISSTYNGLPVTEIADSAFKGNHYIESVIIPNSVKTIAMMRSLIAIV